MDFMLDCQKRLVIVVTNESTSKSNIDSKKITMLTLCDLSKAFDSVSHEILLKKCSALEIDVFWFKNYIENRAQSVHLNNTYLIS